MNRNKIKTFRTRISAFIFLLIFLITCQTNSQSIQNFNPDTIKAGRFDTGKMWTFEFPPKDYFEEEYNFKPTDEWFENVQKSALRFATYCSASFVSEDGLIMTNHHCARQSVTLVDKEGENLHENGFIATTLEEEKQVPGLYVDQLVLIKDVTDEIQDAIENAISDSERTEIEQNKIAEIEERFKAETGLEISVTPLYYGAKYSLYGYKRYEDVRLVFAPESQAGAFGGDFDNFTYPRYNLDCSFFRVYDENGLPLKTDHYLKWSDAGIEPGEPVFVVGNPASTDRLNTVAQLEYKRDVLYPRIISLLKNLIETYQALIENNPDYKNQLTDQLLSYQNSVKAYTGMLKGLNDTVLMLRKTAFEKKFREGVQSNTELNDKYGNVWNKISDSINKIREKSNKSFALSLDEFSNPQYFYIADEMISIAGELELPDSERSEYYKGDELQNTINSLFPDDFDFEVNDSLLKEKVDLLYKYFGKDDEFVKTFTGGKEEDDAVENILSRSFLTSKEGIRKLIDAGPKAILNSDDPFIYYIQNAVPIAEKLDSEISQLEAVEESFTQKLGMALFDVYGTSIPPDATFTLRISDGVIKGFPYNGTIAPPITTFYGMYDRYFSFDKKFPWNLNQKWIDALKELDLSTPLNFVATNDITGGNSGSPVINKNAEVVGLAFDGNIQGLPGSFIYDDQINRMVAVNAEGMIEAIRKVYKFDRLANELKSGHLAK